MALWILLLALSSTAVCHPAEAAPQLLGEYGPWKTFAHGQGRDRKCFMVSEPSEQKGNYTSRGKPHILITHTPGQETFDTISIVAGYVYKPQSEVELTVGTQSFSLFPHDDTAWARDAQTDTDIVSALKAGNNLIVKGTSTRGTLTTDTYSLNGVTAAHATITKNCPKPNTTKTPKKK